MENFANLLILETAKLKLPKYEVKDNAPSSLKEALEAYKQHGRLIIWSGASHNTIWQAPEFNWLFRAWHDFCHVKLQSEFDDAGELRTFKLQASQTESSFLQQVLELEIVGQLEYYNSMGVFPENQIEFFKSKLGGIK